MHAKKSLGQHFLPESYCRKMVSRLALTPTDPVLEIGTGPGGLTRALLAVGCPVTSIEIDEQFAEVSAQLQAEFPHFTPVQADFLQVAVADLIPPGSSPWKVVANIPYYITTAILEKLLGPERRYFSDLYLLMQTEVADRIASEGQRESGSLTLFVGYHASARRLLNVPGHVFFPPARVDSTLVHLAIRPAPPVAADEKALFSLIHTAFMQRRKMLRTSLRSRYNPAQLDEALRHSGVDPMARPETLSLDDFARLTDALQQAQP